MDSPLLHLHSGFLVGRLLSEDGPEQFDGPWYRGSSLDCRIAVSSIGFQSLLLDSSIGCRNPVLGRTSAYGTQSSLEQDSSASRLESSFLAPGILCLAWNPLPCQQPSTLGPGILTLSLAIALVPWLRLSTSGRCAQVPIPESPGRSSTCPLHQNAILAWNFYKYSKILTMMQ
jgi:hypothetical protein